MKFILLIIIFIFISCSHSVHLVHMSDQKLDQKITAGKKIKAQSEQTVILGFVFDTNYVEEARNKLIASCPSGEISNIMTRYSTSHAFFHWKNIIYTEAICFN